MEVRRIQLYAELALLNLNLPARVYLPLYDAAPLFAHRGMSV
jgi:hypothetical protein